MGEEVKEESQQTSGDSLYILISEKEWVTILKSYIKMSYDLGVHELIEYFESLYRKYEELKKKDYVIEFYYSLPDGALKLYVRPREEYEIYRKKLFQIYGIA